MCLFIARFSLSVCLIQMKQFTDEETPTASVADSHEHAIETNVTLDETENDDESQQKKSKLIRMEDVHVAEEFDNIDRQLSIESEWNEFSFVNHLYNPFVFLWL